VDNDGNLQASVKNVSQQMTASGIGQLVGSPQCGECEQESSLAKKNEVGK
jgi:hypothetical protein